MAAAPPRGNRLPLPTALSPPTFGTGRTDLSEARPVSWLPLAEVLPAWPGKSMHSLAEEWTAGVGNLPLLQGALKLEQALLPPEPGFDPFADEHIAGWEEYAPWFRHVRSKRALDLAKAQIVDLHQRRETLAREGSFAGQLLVELANPVNYTPFPVLRGVGLVRGALRGAGAGASVLAAEEGLRSQVDPFSTHRERMETMVYGTIFAAGIGGGVGFLTGGGASVARLAETFRREAEAVDARVRGEPEPVAPAPVRPTPPPVGGEVPTPAGATAPLADLADALGREEQFGPEPGKGPAPPEPEPAKVAGLKPVLGGFERSAKMVALGRLVSLGSAAIQEVALRIGGDRGWTMRANTPEGGFQPTPESAFLNSGHWRGLALQTLQDWTGIYARYLTGNAGRELLGVNLVTAKARLGGLYRHIAGKQRADQKMEWHEFMEAITSAYKADRLEHPDPFVMEGVAALERYLVPAGEAGVKSGAIRSKDGLRRLYGRKVDTLERWLKQAEELGARPARTVNEEAALRVLTEVILKKADEVERLQKYGLRTDDELLAIIEDIEEQGRVRAAKAGEKATTLAAEIAARRAEALRKIVSLEQVEQQRGLSDKAAKYLQHLRERWGFVEPEAAATAAGLPLLPEGLTREQWQALRTPEGPFSDWLRAQRDTAGAMPSLDETLGWLAANAEHPGWRALAQELRDLNLQVRLEHADDLGNVVAYAHVVGRRRGTMELAPGGYTPFTVLHETMHFATWRALDQDPALKAQAEAILAKVRAAVGPGREAFEGLALTNRTRSLGYGLTSIDEMWAEAFVNPRFQELLRRIPAEGRPGSVWDQLADLIKQAYDRLRELLQLPPTTGRNALDELLDLRGDVYRRNAGIRGETPTRTPQAGGEGGARTLPVDEAGWTARQRAYEAQLKAAEAQPLSQRQQAYLDALRRQLDGVDEWDGPKGEKHYLPHIWNVSAVEADEAGPKLLRGKLTILYQLEEAERQASGKKARSPEQIAQAADKTIQRILTGETAGGLFDPDRITEILGSPRLRERAIDLPFEELAPFLERNAEVLLRNHSHRFGVTQALVEMFGERSANDAIDEALVAAARHDLKGTDVEAILAQVKLARQDFRMVHGLATGDAWMWNPQQLGNRRWVQTLQAYGTTTSLHGAGFSSLVEAARPMMIWGVQRVFGQFLKGMGDDLAQAGRAEKHFRELRALTGEAGDVLMSSGVVHTWIGDGMQGSGRSLEGWQGTFDRVVGERLRGFTAGPYFLLNGLSVATDLLKRHSMILSSHFLLEDVRLLAEGRLDDAGREVLASYGIGKADAKRMAGLPVDQGERLVLPELAAWPEELRLKFGMAVASVTRRSVVTAGPGDVPGIAKGFLRNGREIPLLRLPFTFMNWAFAANNKLLLSALQGRDRSPLAGVFALVGMGYLTSWLKSDDNIWDNLPMGERIMRAVDTSGVMGMWSDIPNMVEVATLGHLGVRPALGLKPRGGQIEDILGELGGPGIQRPADIIGAFVREPVTGRERAGAVRRAIPLSSIPWWRGAFDAAERGLTSSPPPSPRTGAGLGPVLPGAMS